MIARLCRASRQGVWFRALYGGQREHLIVKEKHHALWAWCWEG